MSPEHEFLTTILDKWVSDGEMALLITVTVAALMQPLLGVGVAHR
ncbi:hypothetical protein ACFOE0_16930 [Shewanella submarina]|uniref:Uncharacterized protein n=1 Tax=Shewanella submarina TaxID=2016376 RepID=A0ABV7GHU7_9GAMM|nr:hypothetical protein [Shewanella submarina]